MIVFQHPTYLDLELVAKVSMKIIANRDIESVYISDVKNAESTVKINSHEKWPQPFTPRSSLLLHIACIPSTTRRLLGGPKT
jgi:hypothetical protein